MRRVAFALLFFVSSVISVYSEPSVTITKVEPSGRCGSYYQVVLDFDNNDSYESHYLIGQKYAQAIIKAYYNGDYEASISTYIRQSVAAFSLNGLDYTDFLKRVSDLMAKCNDPGSEFELYGAEIKGMESVFNARENGRVTADRLYYLFSRENQLTLKELYLINFIPDVFTEYGCTSLSVWGAMTSGGSLLIGKNTDFFAGYTYDGHTGKVTSMHAVHYFKNQKGKKDMVAVGFLGCLMINEKGVNPDGLLVGENVSKYMADHYDSSGKYPTPAVMRYCLENFSTVDESEHYLMNGKSFPHGNLITIADSKGAEIIENSYNGSFVRIYNSPLKAGVVTDSKANPPQVWDYRNFAGPVLAATNCFQLTQSPDNLRDTSLVRLGTIETMLLENDDDGVVTVDDLVRILSQKKLGGGQKDIFRTDSSSSTLQSMVYDPVKQTIKVHFSPCPNGVKWPYIPAYTDLHVGFIGR